MDKLAPHMCAGAVPLASEARGNLCTGTFGPVWMGMLGRKENVVVRARELLAGRQWMDRRVMRAGI